MTIRRSLPRFGPHRMRVALMTGCAQKALNTNINDAAIRILCRLGCEVVVTERRGLLRCANDAPYGQNRPQPCLCRRQYPRLDGQKVDAVVINTSGCGTTVKDYGHMFRGDPLASQASEISANHWIYPNCC